MERLCLRCMSVFLNDVPCSDMSAGPFSLASTRLPTSASRRHGDCKGRKCPYTGPQPIFTRGFAMTRSEAIHRRQQNKTTLENLEQRLLFATFAVTSNADSGAGT